MNPWLLGAAALTVLIAVAHSLLGEQRIFRHLRRGSLVPTEGGTVLREFQVRILWGAWHVMSVLGLALALVLLWLARQALPPANLAHGLAAAMAASGLLVGISNRGRHPAWAALAGVAVLIELGLR